MTATQLITGDIAPGLANPPHDGQRIFRAVLDAFAHPGRIAAIPALSSAPTTVSPAAAAFMLTLVDRDTPLPLAAAFDSDAVRNFVRFHTGAPLVIAPGDAAFALLPYDREPMFDGFSLGTERYPDQSATLLIEVPDLRGGPALTWRGPGIDGRTTVAVAGLADSFWADWNANRALFPCGIDVVFAAGSELLALPRGIAVEA